MEMMEEPARRRIAQCHNEQMTAIAAVRKGVPLQAEPKASRMRGRIEAQARIAPDSILMRQVAPSDLEARDKAGPEQVWGPSMDFVGVAFLERGMHAARTVGRVAYMDRSPQGTGFLIAPGLFLTNNHVLESAERCSSFVVEFDYEVDASGRHREVSRFSLAPNEFFITDDRDDLDYTVVAIGPKLEGPDAASDFGYTALSGAGNKHTLGEVANIVQHPDGRLKEVVLRENRLVSRLSHVLHYVADTEPGSSGSPVFNNQWQVIALHHWGGPWRQDRGPDGLPVPRYVNEGIRISAIVGELRQRLDELASPQRVRLEEAIALGEKTAGLPVTNRARPSSLQGGGVELRPDGTAVWRMPIEIAVGVPGLSGSPTSITALGGPATVSPPRRQEAFKREVDEDYEDREGYRADFIQGHDISLPRMKRKTKARAAKNLEAAAGDDAFEFRYQHFSVYVDKMRRLPLMTACNIDGSKLKNINRKTGQVTRAEGFEDSSFAPEGRERWYADPRIDPDECSNDDLYLNQVVPPGPDRTSRIFHRGHMVRRLDPCWGPKADAVRAEADTFHFANCTPQIGRFNSRNAFWQGIENHVLNNAREGDVRVTVFTGPVIDDANDPPYRNDAFPGFRVPMRFWKIAVWVEDGQLTSLSLLADQGPVLLEMPEFAEALGDTENVEDFISTVTEIERLTKLDFGDAVRDADLFEEVLRESVGGTPEGKDKVSEGAEVVRDDAERSPPTQRKRQRKSVIADLAVLEAKQRKMAISGAENSEAS